jgi:superfamily II DNA or RNA helicase
VSVHTVSTEDDEIAAIRTRLTALDAERTALEARLAEIAEIRAAHPAAATPPPPATVTAVTQASSSAEKIALFRSLFRGRDDVFPRRWTNPKSGKSGYAPACANEWIPLVCDKPRIKCGDCPNRRFLPVTDTIIAQHLRGEAGGRDGRDFTISVYPMLPDETCWFLAADFDKSSWMRDVGTFLTTCSDKGVPAVLERSRSGNGGHVWIFFAEPIPASLARRLGASILIETLDRHPDIGFESYDRFFPNQDTMPSGGFGNLIALPLQRRPRQSGNSVFLDADFQPFLDQWQFLSTVRRMSLAEVSTLVETAERSGRILGVRLPIVDEDEEPRLAPPSRRKPDQPIIGPMPASVDMVLGDQIYIARAGLPPALVSRLVRLAAFQNPEFYRKQAMRFPTFGIPRIIGCADLLSHHIALPRGCRDQAEALLASVGIVICLRDERQAGRSIDATFLGKLVPEQQEAVDGLLKHEIGVLAATTAFGKTVVAAAIIAARKANTLILVHRRQLLDQWATRLGTFLDLPPGSIGQIGGGKRRPTGIVDVAVIQSLVRAGEVADIVGDYGHLVVDECHHLSAVSFELVAKRCKARHILGLSATVTRKDGTRKDGTRKDGTRKDGTRKDGTRKDGHHPIIFMQCGPVRFRADARRQAAKRPFTHRVILRRTGFSMPPGMDDSRMPIQNIYTALMNDDRRNDMILADVLKALEAKRSPVILTERKQHAHILAERLSCLARNVVLLQGGVRTKQRRAVAAKLQAIPEEDERLLIATGRYIGEGFDDARLDTLFLTMPISWRGTLAQYAGRLHRLHPAKREVIVYDYVDDAVPLLARMNAKRNKGYESLGYSIEEGT